MTKKRLGKGLQALIPELEDAPLSEAVAISVDEIKVNPYQPRKHFDEEKLAELSLSVSKHGLIQPLVVRRAGDAYELVAGERRLRAAKKAGLKKVPVMIRSLNAREMMEIALIENLQREDLNPLEEAEAYRRLVDEHEYTQEQLAERVGKSRSAVANTLRLLTLTQEVREYVFREELSEGHARALLSLPPELQGAAARKVVELGLSVREAERLVSEQSQRVKRKPINDAASTKDPYIEDMEEQLRQALGAGVKVRVSSRGSGKMEIHFYGREDLERLCEHLLQ